MQHLHTVLQQSPLRLGDTICILLVNAASLFQVVTQKDTVHYLKPKWFQVLSQIDS